MPRARANIKAKLSAQIDTGVNFVVITRAPAATSSPAMVRRSGRPAATRLPKAITRMMIVTGHDSSSDLSMAERLAVLKLAHSALSPVRVTLTPDVASAASLGWTASAASTILFELAAAPAVMIAVRPSREIETPACDGTTVDTRGSLRSTAVALATAAWAWGSDAIGPLWSTMTTCSPVAPRPAKSFSITARAAMDWLLEACHPAPARALSTCTAKNPNTISTSSHPMSTRRKWVADHLPSLANGLGRLAWTVSSVPPRPSPTGVGSSLTSVSAVAWGASSPVPRVAAMGRHPLIRPAHTLGTREHARIPGWV